MPVDIDPRLLTLPGAPMGVLASLTGSLRRFLKVGRLRSRTKGSAAPQQQPVSIHVKVADVNKFAARPGVRVRSVAGPNAAGHFLATASVTPEHVEALLTAPEVIAAELPSRIKPQLAFALQNMAARPEDLPLAQGDRGAGVVVGIIDSGGLDYRLPSFRNAAGGSRISFLRVLDGNHEFTKAQFDQALKSGKHPPNYPALTASANLDELDSHATAVADCAAGGNPDNPGVASKAEIIYVELANKFLWKTYPENFAESTELVDAVDYIFKKAGQKPCVINISQGTIEGPANGFSLACEHFEVLLAAQSNRALVVSAGNYGDDLFHAALTVGASDTGTASFRIWPRSDPTKKRGWHELNAWYAPHVALSLKLVSPTSQYGPFPLGQGPTSIVVGGNTIFEWAHLHRPNLQQNQLYLGFSDAAPAGIWKLEISSVGPKQGQNEEVHEVHLYIIGGSNASDPSFEGEAVTRSHTLVSLACSENVISVGAHDALPGGANRLCLFSSVGPTRAGVLKPDLTAPGVSVRMAQPGGKLARAQGTSFSAPLVAGVAALCLSEARSRGGQLTAAELRQILVDFASQDSSPRVWDPGRGWGRVNARAALDEIARRFP